MQRLVFGSNFNRITGLFTGRKIQVNRCMNGTKFQVISGHWIVLLYQKWNLGPNITCWLSNPMKILKLQYLAQ